MLDFDHIAITVKDLEESILFYTKFGYELKNSFNNVGYKWATLKLNNHFLKLFQMTNDKEKPFNHIAYSYDDDSEAIELIKKIGYKEDLDSFYGDLNRKSFF